MCLRYGKLDLSKIKPIKKDWVKPTGGLWTSTFTPNAKWCSAWVAWCATEMPDWLTDNCCVLYPRKEARVYTINSYEDLLNLVKKFGYVVEKPFVFPNWENVAKRYDAVHLTAKGQWETRYTRPLNLYGWDVESTLWFRNVFTKAIPLSIIPHKCRVV